MVITGNLQVAVPAVRFTCSACHGKNNQQPVLQSMGMGIESTAITLRWLFDPTSRNFCLCQLTLITAQTGDEHTEDTQPLMEKYILPLLRQHNIRFVEVARAGPAKADGIVVLQDTREPFKIHAEGRFRLSDELLLNGTVPQTGGVHTCALKSKVDPIETWCGREIITVSGK